MCGIVPVFGNSHRITVTVCKHKEILEKYLWWWSEAPVFPLGEEINWDLYNLYSPINLYPIVSGLVFVWRHLYERLGRNIGFGASNSLMTFSSYITVISDMDDEWYTTLMNVSPGWDLTTHARQEELSREGSQKTWQNLYQHSSLRKHNWLL